MLTAERRGIVLMVVRLQVLLAFLLLQLDPTHEMVYEYAGKIHRAILSLQVHKMEDVQEDALKAVQKSKRECDQMESLSQGRSRGEVGGQPVVHLTMGKGLTVQ
ncbi:uncharacterized protein MEPE_02951 [Melanopsichium pennsylvanicum]|uniref:Uncharacterized protein n=1 Tax=Melanopsichium pennsylvanicum TaxID=63383 RepID=A0AAJ4XLC3_9BASI|nr:uncharacterized protein MEPE_02951 [Melanopsichium pennsylvanicum]